MKNLLIIANDFPFPISGGNLRMFKLIKYLSKKKDLKIFLLINKSKDQKLVDLEFMRDVTIIFNNENNIINHSDYKTTEIKSYKFKWLKSHFKRFLIIDRYLYTWVIPGLFKYYKLIKKNRIDFVITTSPTISTHFFALFSKYFFKKIFWVADFRDLWFLSPEIQRSPKIIKFVYYHIEKFILTKSDYNIFVSNSIKNITINNFNLLDGKKNQVITNGFDPDDFIGINKNYVKNEFYQIGYFGTIYDERQNNYLCESLVKYIKQLKSEKIKFLFYGEFNPDFKEKFKTLIEQDIVIFNKNLNHIDALSKMYQMDALLLILTNSLEGKIAFTGKFFEYLKIGKPILSLVPNDSEVSLFLRSQNVGISCMPDNIDEIFASILNMKYSKFDFVHEVVLNDYSREKTSELFYNILVNKS